MKRMYDCARWRKARRNFLLENQLCVLCLRQGRDTPANVVDHIKPHGGDYELFWDRVNWQALCKQCHDSSKKIKQNTGVYPGCDVNGMPIDPDHEWGKS